MKKIISYKKVVSTGDYRICFNHQVFEVLCTLNAISATVVSKNFSGTEYNVSSVDGNTYSISLFINKLWDIILMKLTELVHRGKWKGMYEWDACEEWDICISIHTIAECMDLPNSTDALGKLYNRIIDAAKVLQNIKIEVENTIRRPHSKYVIPGQKIDGYLSFVGVRDYSDNNNTVTKSDACFCFRINPALIEYIGTQKTGLYHFDHCWLFLSEQSQNTYAAAKRLGRYYSQTTYKQRDRKTATAITSIGTLRNCLPCLNNKDEGDNRAALDNALQSIPGAQCFYIRNNETLTFGELKQLRLRTPRYNRTKIGISFDEHPNTSKNRVTQELIRHMNDDALYQDFHFYTPEEAEALINHAGRLKQHNACKQPDDEAGTA